jgi:cellulose biosynthesis protein BcsQ
MTRIELLIADDDQDYVHCLVDYIMFEHAAKFTVTSFTEVAAFLRFLEEGIKPPDVLLVGFPMAQLVEKVPPEKRGLVLVLSGERQAEGAGTDGEGFGGLGPQIYKYQYGEKIIGEVLRFLAEETSASAAREYSFRHERRATKVIGFFSPVGGVGKTTLAVGASIQTAWEGKSCFYLNLENMASTPLYFTGEQEENLSGVLYYLKNKAPNLSLQLEKAKCIDPVTKIAYYQPPDSIIDFKEDISAELKALLQELRAGGQYERIMVDLSAEVNKNNLTVLRACDRIVLLAEQNMTSLLKLRKMYRELQLLTSREGWDITEKMLVVLNKYKYPDDEEKEAELHETEEECRVRGKGVLLKIPLVYDLTIFQEGRYRLDLNSDFGKALYEVLQVL